MLVLLKPGKRFQCKKDGLGNNHRYFCDCGPWSFTKHIHIAKDVRGSAVKELI